MCKLSASQRAVYEAGIRCNWEPAIIAELTNLSADRVAYHIGKLFVKGLVTVQLTSLTPAPKKKTSKEKKEAVTAAVELLCSDTEESAAKLVACVHSNPFEGEMRAAEKSMSKEDTEYWFAEELVYGSPVFYSNNSTPICELISEMTACNVTLTYLRRLGKGTLTLLRDRIIALFNEPSSELYMSNEAFHEYREEWADVLWGPREVSPVALDAINPFFADDDFPCEPPQLERQDRDELNPFFDSTTQNIRF